MLQIGQITVVYPDGTKAVDNLSLSVGGGESIALLGENGAGKTSLLLAVVGILPARGTVEIDGVTLTKKTVHEIRRRIGLVFQNPDDQLFMPLLYDDIAFGCRNLGWPEARVREKVERTLEQLRIGHLRDKSPLKLSGGEKRMAAVATALAMEPSVLLLDEPTAFLDPKAKRKLAEALKGLEQAKLIATHDMAFAAAVCDRVLVLQKGRIAADGAADLLYHDDIMRNCGLEAAIPR